MRLFVCETSFNFKGKIKNLNAFLIKFIPILSLQYIYIYVCHMQIKYCIFLNQI